MQRPRRFCGVVLALATAATMVGCGYSLKTKFPDPPAVTPRARPLIALLGAVDLRLRRGAGRTHREERTPSPGSDAYRRWPYPLDPWNRYDEPAAARTDEVRYLPTGELGSDEVLVPLLDALSRRLGEHAGKDSIRDATTDPLAEDPDPSRAQAFLSRYPAYDSAVWVELLGARADLPEMSAIQGAFTAATCCSAGLLGTLFLIPLPADTPVELKVRAYLLPRSAANPQGAAVGRKLTVEARASAGVDIDEFRAGVADLLARDAGTRLADELMERLALEGGTP